MQEGVDETCVGPPLALSKRVDWFILCDEGQG